MEGTNMETLNGQSVTRRGNTIFIPLPRSMWTLVCGDGKCACPFCRSVRGRLGYWDTVAVCQDPGKRAESGPDTSWLVHQPEGNPDRLRNLECCAGDRNTGMRSMNTETVDACYCGSLIPVDACHVHADHVRR